SLEHVDDRAEIERNDFQNARPFRLDVLALEQRTSLQIDLQPLGLGLEVRLALERRHLVWILLAVRRGALHREQIFEPIDRMPVALVDRLNLQLGDALRDRPAIVAEFVRSLINGQQYAGCASLLRRCLLRSSLLAWCFL